MLIITFNNVKNYETTEYISLSRKILTYIVKMMEKSI